jgi:amino acid transporter
MRGSQHRESELLRAEASIKERSGAFKKELGLTDLVLTQILFIIGLGWIGTAAKLGSSHFVFWLLAVVLFYLPSAAVVIYLNTLMPLEGGLYQWAKLGFNELAGFMVAWNLWIYAMVLTSELGVQAASTLAYVLGPDFAWLAGSKWFMTAASCVLIGTLAIISIVGLGLGKWVHNAGGLVMIAIFVLLVALPLINRARGSITGFQPFPIAVPAITLFDLNILGKLGFAALGGFEYVAIFAGECRNPVRTIGGSVVIAAPLIALMFIIGTSSVQAFIRPADVDLIAPIPQVLTAATAPLGIAFRWIPIVILAVLGLRVAQASINLNATARLPLVAGWDRLLPQWFTKLSPRYKTPANSIVFVGAITLVVGLAGISGVGQQEAFQLLNNSSGIFYALTYLVMFAIPLAGLKELERHPPMWLRAAALSGFLMTLLYVVLSVFPIIPVGSRLSFTSKIIGLVVLANLIGCAIFLVELRRRS